MLVEEVKSIFAWIYLLIQKKLMFFLKIFSFYISKRDLKKTKIKFIKTKFNGNFYLIH